MQVLTYRDAGDGTRDAGTRIPTRHARLSRIPAVAPPSPTRSLPTRGSSRLPFRPIRRRGAHLRDRLDPIPGTDRRPYRVRPGHRPPDLPRGDGGWRAARRAVVGADRPAA